MVVWRADLYQKEALRQLSDTSFYAKVDKDLTSTNQQIVKSTINDLIVKQELPPTASNLIITTPRTSCIYFLPKRYQAPANSVAPPSVYKPHTTHNSSICSDEGLTLETSAFESPNGG